MNRWITFFAATLGMTAVSFAQVGRFQDATRFSWGAGDNLPSPYTQLDMNVEVRYRVGFFWFTQNIPGGIDELQYPKTAGELGFVIDTSNVNPLLPPLLVDLTGTLTGTNQVDWAFDETFSQTGGWNIQTTLDVNGTPVAVNLTLNNIRVNGELRAVFSSVPSFFNAALNSDADIRGLHSGGDAQNFLNFIPSSVSGTIAGLGVNALEVRARQIQHVFHVPVVAPPTVTGTITLEDLVGPCTDPVSWKLYNGTTEVASGTTILGTNGAYSIQPNVAPGSYSLAMTGRTHLTGGQTVTLVSGTTSGVNFTLVNGDVDQDNEVGPGDFGNLALAFLSADGDPNWNALADLDCDGEVGPGDFGILANNFLQSGWTP